MKVSLSTFAVLALSAGPALAGSQVPPGLPSTGILTLSAAAVAAAVFLARRKK